MTSKTSFCNSTLLRKNLSRFWPLWVMFTLGLLLVLHSYLGSMRDYITYMVDYDYNNIVLFHVVFSDLLLLPYSVICAACCFSYLHKSRSAYMLHAFPVTRGVLFRTSLLSGLLFFLMPWTAVMLLNVLESISAPVLLLTALLESYVLGILEYLFFYGLAVACMHITGKTVYGVLTYLALNVSAILIQSLTLVVLQPLLYGMEIADSITFVYTPFLQLFNFYNYPWDTSLLSLWDYVSILAGIGVLFMVVAWLLYRKRAIESCGETIVFSFARPIFQYLLTLLSALCLGLLSMGLTYGDIYINGRLMPTMIFLLLGGFVGYWAAEMMLQRSLRVFRPRTWIGYGCFAAVLILALCAVRFDWFCIVGRVPDTEDISYVEITSDSYDYRSACPLILTDTDDINQLRAVHQHIVDGDCQNQEHYYDETSLSLVLNYHLKNGDTLTRTYTICEKTPEAYYGFSELVLDTDINVAAFSSLFQAEDITVQACAYTHTDFADITLRGAEINLLKDCLITDAQQGRITVYPDVQTQTSLMIIITTKPGTDTSHTYRIYVPSSAERTYRYLLRLQN